MKRNENKVPEFDDIIFENRNKNYGAYVLRKSYKTTASISILGVVALSVVLMAAAKVKPEPVIKPVVPIESKSVFTDLEKIIQPPSVPPPVKIEPPKYVTPEVTDDTSQVFTQIAVTAEITQTIVNGKVDDPVKYIDDPEPVIPVEPDPVVIVQEMPEFPGGIPALMSYISQNIHYPEEAFRNNIEGRVNLKFVVKSDGSVDRVEVLRGVDSSLNAEAVRVVKTLPRFKPGRQGGVAVPVWFNLPVVFRIENN